MTATEHVILVDENDQILGTAEKLAAHRQGLCHRAFSVFILRNPLNPEILLQQRADHKYHSPGLWTNTCCSHPRPAEEIIAAGQRRLKEELGLSLSLTSVGKFHYIANFDNGLIENEVDYVLVGYLSTEIVEPNPEEVKAIRWITIEDLKNEMMKYPERFTPWLGRALSFVSPCLREVGEEKF